MDFEDEVSSVNKRSKTENVEGIVSNKSQLRNRTVDKDVPVVNKQCGTTRTVDDSGAESLEFCDEGAGVVISLTVPTEEDHFSGTDDDVEEEDEEMSSNRPKGSHSGNNNAQLVKEKGGNNESRIKRGRSNLDVVKPSLSGSGRMSQEDFKDLLRQNSDVLD